ncbi:MAG: hypothetical protein AAF657_22260 [Acidobacteriota bacterium]
MPHAPLPPARREGTSQSFDLSRVYFAWVAASVALTWLIHELAHWATGTLLGYRMYMTLNSAGLAAGEYEIAWHGLAVSSAGPVITLLQAGVVFLILRKTPIAALYPFLFVPFYMRLLAGALNLIHLNDEGRVGQALGLGTYTIPAIVSLVLLGLVIQASRRAGLEARFQAGTTLAVMFFSSILILLDQFQKIRLL